MKFKQSFFRRISPIFLAAVVLVSSLCFAAPVSAASTASNASSALVLGSFSEASNGFYRISGTWVFNEVVSLPSSYLSFYTLPDSDSTYSFYRILGCDGLFASFAKMRDSGGSGYLLYCSRVSHIYDTGSYLSNPFPLTHPSSDGTISSCVWDSSVSRYFIFDGEAYISSSGFEWLFKNATPYVDLVSNAREQTSSFLSVFSSIGEWVVSSFLSLVALFWVPESGLTFFGVLAVSGLAFALIFLLIRWILSLVHR